ncbi:MAG: protein translocase subunit SecF [Candidatus Pacearchaeota archaeon]|nr:protein translocase subunit SecF [Candidatus Pacearchaeota archaeon]
MESGENKEEQNEQKREEYEEKNFEEETKEKVKIEGEKEKQEIEEKKEVTKAEEKKEQKSTKFKTSLLSSEWYDKNYKKLLIIAVLIFVASFTYLVFFYAQHGDIMNKDVSLTGGTTITVYESKVDVKELENFLTSKLAQEVLVRKLEDISTRRTIAFVVETKADPQVTKTAIEEYLKYELDDKNSSIEISGSALAQSFYSQLLIAIAIAFVFMAIVVFIVFKTFVPSIAVLFAAATDIIGALAIINLLGFRISTAGIAAFLMLIGYSVDTDIMLTTKVIKRRGEGTVNSRIKSAFKTGLVMTLTSLIAVFTAYFIVEAYVIKEIFLVLSCGLFIDLLSTWLGNAAIIKLYCEKKNIN